MTKNTSHKKTHIAFSPGDLNPFIKKSNGTKPQKKEINLFDKLVDYCTGKSNGSAVQRDKAYQSRMQEQFKPTIKYSPKTLESQIEIPQNSPIKKPYSENQSQKEEDIILKKIKKEYAINEPTNKPKNFFTIPQFSLIDIGAVALITIASFGIYNGLKNFDNIEKKNKKYNTCFNNLY